MPDKEVESLKTLTEMLSVLTENNKLLKEDNKLLKENNKLLKENLNKLNNVYEINENNHETIEDIGTKIDLIINIDGTKKPKSVFKKIDVSDSKTKKIPKKPKASSSTETKVVEPKVINNIMSYFKQRYIEDNTYFDEILEEKQAEALFKEHEKLISSKKGDAKQNAAKANLIYKDLSDSQRKKVREKMTDENETISTNNDDDIEEENSD